MRVGFLNHAPLAQGADSLRCAVQRSSTVLTDRFAESFGLDRFLSKNRPPCKNPLILAFVSWMHDIRPIGLRYESMSQSDQFSLATRASLLGRLKDLDDQASWQEFLDTYWRL